MKNKPSTATPRRQRTATLLYITAVLVLSIAIWGFTDAAGEKTKSTNHQPPTAASPIDGNWVTVWSRDTRTGQVQDRGKPTQFKTFQDGHFSLIAWDSAGKLSYAGYGKYELQGNKYKETFAYHSHLPYTGGQDVQTYELRGDTLYFRGFDQVVVGGKDVTAEFGKFEEKRVRAK